MSTSGRLTALFQKAERIYYNPGDKFVMMSDCHRGVGTLGDNFLKNRHIYLTALRYYYRKKYTYLELGDGDELWENKKMEEICKTHREVFEVIEAFQKEGKLYVLYGNHDMKKKNAKEGLILEECGTGRKIFLVHGHQGDLFNDRLWRVNRFLVRHIWRRLELLGMENPMSASGSGRKKSKVEKKLAEWADNNRQMTVAGHTHRVKFPSDSSSYYFNDGSCVRPGSITCIEMENRVLRLVEWSVMTNEHHVMYIGRRVLDEIGTDLFYHWE